LAIAALLSLLVSGVLHLDSVADQLYSFIPTAIIGLGTDRILARIQSLRYLSAEGSPNQDGSKSNGQWLELYKPRFFLTLHNLFGSLTPPFEHA